MAILPALPCVDKDSMRFHNPGTSAEVVEWQTRTFEGRVGVSPCGFKSRLRHQHPTDCKLTPYFEEKEQGGMVRQSFVGG